ncbi:DUF4166 domain-containing protein [Sorangium atrum]|uniref:DUF4166 domain-containing protein n=1 Tax=Sorangium atrum TaxID=2995308 RepID=A0ABT5BSW6_9BACT|nr:DUF4166 domain-containing protein [Sorangium aterium]MDC0677187.1 DUF4166 domain-containing protein [Sorangium aterium]
MPGSAGEPDSRPTGARAPCAGAARGAPAPALYPALLGAAWAALAPPVQRLHAGGARARGRFRVRRGRGLAARLVAGLLRMPEAAEDVAVTLAVEPAGDGERWLRTFGARPLFSSQWRSGDLLVEGLGLVQCWFRLRAEGGALVFEQVRSTLGLRRLGLPLPRWLAPRVEGRAGPLRDEVHVDVRIFAPVAGLLVAYEGRVAYEAGAEAPPARAGGSTPASTALSAPEPRAPEPRA